MSIKKGIQTLLVISAILYASDAKSQNPITLSNVQWPNLSYTSCTPSPVYVNLFLNCTNLVHTGNTFNVNGFNITVNVNYTVTSCNSGFQQPPGFQINLGLLPAGSYAVTVNGTLNSAIQSTLTSSVTVTNNGCCLITADAGNDTSMCNETSVQLKGNNPPPTASGNWTVVSGSGNIVNSALHNTIVNNLSFGVNEFMWTTTDPVCVTTDNVRVINYALTSDAVTESDKSSCYDSSRVHATPIVIGSGQWNAITPGLFIFGKFNPTADVFNLSKGTNLIEWESKNGVCPAKRDTLKIEYQQVTDTPIVTNNAMVLTSSMAPSYQWYMNQSAIPGETNQSYTATSNGMFKVFAVEPGCDNGLFSNEIEITGVGIDEMKKETLNLYPNPSNGIITIYNIDVNSDISIYDVNGRLVFHELSQTPSINIDLSDFPKGVYSISVKSSAKFSTGKILLK